MYSNTSPIFTIHDSHRFNDYGFDTHQQIDYFHVIGEARKHKRETTSFSSNSFSIFKIQKPISKDDPTRFTTTSNKWKKKRWWWKKAFPFLKWRKRPFSAVDLNDGRRSKDFCAVNRSMSGPIYATESRSGSSTPYRTMTPTRKGDVASIPYMSLRELNMDQQQRISTSSSPIYLVT
ncbi:unnamed protein product [Cochlearia groenlandica]